MSFRWCLRESFLKHLFKDAFLISKDGLLLLMANFSPAIILKALIKLGVDVNTQRWEEGTLLHAAAKAGHPCT